MFIIGDMAHARNENDEQFPGLAAVASQQGEHVAKGLRAIVSKGKAADEALKPFRYRDRGSMATIGRARAIADVRGHEFSGLFAWALWLLVHLMLLVQFQSRLLVFWQWAWSYLTFSRSARLITGEDHVNILHLDADTDLAAALAEEPAPSAESKS